MKCNISQTIKFIKENAMKKGYFVNYIYERKYVTENKKNKTGKIKKYKCHIRRWVKNGVIENDN